MGTFVDSSQQQLEPMHIAVMAGPQQGDAQMPTDMYIARLTAELKSGNSIAMKFNNTLFMVTRDPEDQSAAFFRALNADTPQNYLQNCKLFIKYAQQNGMTTLVTQFKDKQLVRLLQAVKDSGQQYYAPGTKMEVLEKDGLYQVSIFANPEQYSGKSSDPNFETPARGLG